CLSATTIHTPSVTTQVRPVLSITAPPAPYPRGAEQSGTSARGRPPPDRRNLMNVLSSGSTLKPGDAVTSANGHYRLELQPDGNLVLSGPRGLAWDSGTRGKGVATAEMQIDGNFVLYTADRGVVWSADTTGPGAHLLLQDDRNVVILAADGTTVLWTPNSYVTQAERADEDRAIAEQAAQEAARQAA